MLELIILWVDNFESVLEAAVNLVFEIFYFFAFKTFSWADDEQAELQCSQEVWLLMNTYLLSAAGIKLVNWQEDF